MAKKKKHSTKQKPPLQADAEQQREQGYTHALELMFYEGQIAWQINILFIALNVGVGTIIQGTLHDPTQPDGVLAWMSFVGLIINVLWLGTFRRNYKYYHF